MKFPKNKKWQLFALLALTTLFNFALVAFRLDYIDFDYSKIQSVRDLMIYRGGQLTFLFLIWNLFLAWIPFWIAISLEKMAHSKVLTVFGLATWLLFFPNAPYIITDLLHIKYRAPVPLWYDVMMIFSFGWTGLMLGFLSLIEVQKFLEKRLPLWLSHSMIFASVLLCGLGVFIGRFQRWNSWDILANPFALAEDILSVLLNPGAHWKTFGLAVVLSVLMLLGHWTLSVLRSEEAK